MIPLSIAYNNYVFVFYSSNLDVHGLTFRVGFTSFAYEIIESSVRAVGRAGRQGMNFGGFHYVCLHKSPFISRLLWNAKRTFWLHVAIQWRIIKSQRTFKNKPKEVCCNNSQAKTFQFNKDAFFFLKFLLLLDVFDVLFVFDSFVGVWGIFVRGILRLTCMKEL